VVGEAGAHPLAAAGLLCPHLNLIEGVWRRLKGFLMPRRFYDPIAELKEAVLHALRLLVAVEVQCSLGDT
jgi:putative transposase